MTKHTLKRRGINRAFTLKERSSFWPSNQNEIAASTYGLIRSAL
ncbi:hypothetical protein J27TS8_08800 [Robertmurraya siralis]|uniref:Uncharacterized protein n=1 Tax=Robertmurraya siralis TaxID=77777 RepID=A0A919WFK6_9BACI|nr:hypothetical protein J27TS8_08800 [Robertmurraya siralis]